MADTKISALPAVTTPVAGTSELPIVQSGATKKVTILQLTGTQVSAAGDVGIGGDTSGVVAGVTVTSKFCVKNEGDGPVAGFVHVNNTTAGTGSGTFACRSRGTTASPAIVQNNDALWNMFVAGHDGTDLALAAQISVEVDGTPGSNDMPGRIRFLTTPDGTQAPVEAMRIDNAQNVTVSAGNLAIGTAGKGIDFSGVGTAGRILTDYETGTFTPVVRGTTVVGTGTYSIQYGAYTKIGNIVYFNIQLDWSAHTGTGNMRLGVLPFASKNVSNNLSSITVGFVNNMTFGASNTISAYLLENSTTIILNSVPVGGGGTAALPMDTAARIVVSGFYEV